MSISSHNNGFWQTNIAAIALANRSTCEPTERRS
jgi:hypothetical protein